MTTFTVNAQTYDTARSRVRSRFTVGAERVFEMPVCKHTVTITANDQNDFLPPCSIIFGWPAAAWKHQPQHVATMRKLGGLLPPPPCRCYWLATAIQLHMHRYSNMIELYVEQIAKSTDRDMATAAAHRDVLMMLRDRASTRLAFDVVDMPLEMRLQTTLNRVVEKLIRQCRYSVVSPEHKQTAIVACLTKKPMVSLRRGIDLFFGAPADHDHDIRSVIRLGLPHGWLAHTRDRDPLYDRQLIIDERDDARLLLVERMQHLYMEWVPR